MAMFDGEMPNSQPKAVVEKAVSLSDDELAKIIARYLRETLKDNTIMIVPSNLHITLRDRTHVPEAVRITWEEKIWE